ncbi:MAG: hypothetical protein ACF8GE_12215 [Phycisphaerales bacterium JB043]
MRLTRSHTLALILLTSSLLVSGCNIIAPGMYLLHGRGQVEPVVVLDPFRPTVVFIDDRASVLPRRSLRMAIGQEADSTLIEKGVVRQEALINSAAPLRYAVDERYGEPRPVSEVGLAVGADVIIYAECVTWTLSRDGASTSPFAMMRVKILDAQNRMHIWPLDGSSAPLRVELPRSAAPLPTTRTEQQALERTLAQTLGFKLARLFYRHERDQLDG